eukprot:scaffold109_cov252-Pinguiococcus_pyrenoidosus.AAC.64
MSSSPSRPMRSPTSLMGSGVMPCDTCRRPRARHRIPPGAQMFLQRHREPSAARAVPRCPRAPGRGSGTWGCRTWTWWAGIGWRSAGGLGEATKGQLCRRAGQTRQRCCSASRASLGVRRLLAATLQ